MSEPIKETILTFNKSLDMTKCEYIPMIQDFENFTVAVACSKKTEEHTSLILNLNSIFNSIEVLMSKCIEVLEPRLNKTNYFYSLPEIDYIVMDYGIDKIINPKTPVKLKKCLADALKGIKTDGEKDYNDILNPNNPDLNLGNELVDVKTEVDKLKKDFDSEITEAANEAIKSIRKIIMSFLKEEDRILFTLLDKLTKFVKDTSFIKIYKEFKDADKCIRTNCPVLSPYLYTDEFLFYDEEKTDSILPTSLNHNKLILKAMFEKDYLTPNQIKQADIIQRTYESYLKTKKMLAELTADKVKNSGIPDDRNPFEKVVKDMSFEKTDVVNTLF